MSAPRKRGRPPTDPAIITQALNLVADGAPVKEAARTVGIDWSTLAQHTDARWTNQEAGSLGRAVRIANQKGAL